MKGFGTVIFGIIVCVQSVFAQAPSGFTYQAVVRDETGALRSEQMIELHIRIVQGSPTGTLVFEEPHAPMTNTQGLFSIIVGSNNPIDFKLINWENGPFYIQVFVSEELMGTSELVSVPYALHSTTAEIAQSLNYSSLIDAPNWSDSIHVAITEYEGYTNTEIDNLLAQKIDGNNVYTKYDIDTILVGYNKDSYSNEQIDSLLVSVTDTVSYSNAEITTLLSTKADVNDVYTKTETDAVLSSKANSADTYTQTEINALLIDKANNSDVYSQTYLNQEFDAKADTSLVFSRTYLTNQLNTKANSADLATVATSGNYNDLLNKPIIPILVSAFINDSEYITMADMITEAEIITMVTNNGFLLSETDPLFTASTSYGISQIDTAFWNAKSEFDGAYGSLTGKPDLSVYALSSQTYTKTQTDAALALKANTADLSSVAFSGNYNELLFKPSIPVFVSELVNDAGYVTTDRVLTEAEVVTMVQSNGFLNTESDPFFIASPSYSITSTDITNWNNKSDFDGNYSSLLGTPNLSVYALASNVYTTTEIDAALLAKVSVADLVPVAVSNDYYDLNNRPTLPTNVSDLVNDAGYITVTDIVDNEIDNEIQTLGLSGNTLTISHTGGNSVTFTGWDVDASDDVSLSSNQTIVGDKVFSGKITVATPVDNTDAANKAYVDALESQISAIELQNSVLENQIASMNAILLNAGLPGTVTDNDGNVYSTRKIGTQIWITENLKTTTFNDGTAIDFPNTDGSAWTANISGAYAWYQDNSAFKDSYGALYNWYAVASNKLCPTGWRVATDADWQTLETYLGMADASNTGERGTDEGLELRNTDLWAVDGFEILGTNTSGFSATPGGTRAETTGNYSNQTFVGFYWTATENAPNAWFRAISYDTQTVLRDSATKGTGYSVRCIQE